MTTRPTEVSDGLRQASADLVAATRRLMLAAATTDVEPGELRAARQMLDRLADTLGRRTRERVVRAPFEGPEDSRAAGPEHPWTLFAHNPQGIPLTIEFGEDCARARLVANALHEGPHDSLHGGFGAHLMDCMLGTLMQARGKRALTATLDMRYLRRTPLDRPLELSSRIVVVSGRKTIAEGWIECDGVRTVEARGLFVEIERPAA